MTIYGVAVLAACCIIGQLTGEALGQILHIDANVGGVGFGMLLLITVNQWLHKHNLFPKESQLGIGFWSAMYLPVIVAMSATQNVKAALSGGAAALVAGIMVTILPMAMLPMIARLAKRNNT